MQQGVWDLPLESMPLASGYLKAMALADDRLRDRVDITIHNFRGGDSLTKMAHRIFRDAPPDVIAFSVLGWNFREFGALAETFKQVNPDGWVILGGTHVANQAARTFRLFPEVDIIVNGEGELVFPDLLHACLRGTSPHNLGLISGISFRGAGDEVVTTLPRDRIEDLDIIPSPFLTGAIDLTDDNGRFRYDVALMETNRGCPYKCSFCYWGGAVGQRIRAFSRARLRAELELFAQHKVHTIVLCDANFGILPIDAEFVEDILAVRAEFGYPRALETSWAKNKSKLFYDIVHTMKQAGLRSSFTLALQTLSDDALRTMNRRNMKVNDWEDLARWLDEEGLDCYAELIWGAPGETVESFMAGYDRLSKHVSRIAVYPLHLLPNTDYSEKKSEYGIVSVRGDHDDFEYLLSHNTMTLQENQFVKRFLFWTRVMAENAVLRHVWVGIRELTELTQSQVLRDLDEWVQQTDDEAAAVLRDAVERAASSDVAYGDAIRYLFGDPDAGRMLERWWREAVRPKLTPDRADLLDEVLRYDLLTQPVYHLPDAAAAAEPLEVVEVRGSQYFVRRNLVLRFDVPAIVSALRRKQDPGLDAVTKTVDLYYRTGAENFIGSTNHEEIVYFMGLTEEELHAMIPAEA
ncbi:KedN5 family methylcobalamin-dependent radical SAM C-methyltransferase [Kibdelosporangium aridum]|uniref:KedN5 family methylcobalamin-dependent radical SAM C-methyltransferase n=1 Tax=Kibdelosporangium aridum TaxID=2030 RepID=UPI0021ADFF97|nr:KedN5 family methylcobalamin-dependent radical SAM C-methyltransferase [Kibdelosporangium aridum]